MNDLSSRLKAIDWPRYQSRYGLCFKEAEIKYMARIVAKNGNDDLHNLIITRCLFSTLLSSYILNRQDTWVHINIDSIFDRDIVAASIEIDVDDLLDHMFTIFKDPGTGRWWIIQSYLRRYTTIVEPINVRDLISTIQRWTTDGVKSIEWERFFHAPMKSTNRCHPHVYICRRYNTEDINTFESEIDRKFNDMVSNPWTYLSEEPYRTLALR